MGSSVQPCFLFSPSPHHPAAEFEVKPAEGELDLTLRLQGGAGLDALERAIAALLEAL